MKKKSNGYLEKYYEDCKNKKYIVGEEIIKELENLIEDFNYYDYDTTEADKRIFFIENCLKLTKSPYYGKSFKLLDFQKAFISALYGFKMPDGTDRFQRAILLIARKNGKALDLNTRIPTTNGDKIMQDIEVGDYVFNPNGEPIKVIATQLFKNRPCYKITFEDGEEIIADVNHEWQTKDKILTTEQLIKDYKHIRHDGKGVEYKYRVPISKSINYENNSCFRYSRKTERLKEKLNNRMNYKSIINIEKVENRDTKCIEVEGGLYLCGNKNTVTHNSELTSALALTEMLIGGKGLDIVCSSNDDIQASILTDAIDTMRTLIDPKNEDTWRNQKGLKCLINNNKVFKLSDKTKNKEGRNIDFAIIDEVHEMKEPIIVKSIEQSQSLKINPKLILITTEGFVFDGFLDNELKRARSILNREVEDEASKRYLIFLFTQDSEQEVWDGNRENRFWEKSNPSLGMIKKYDYLEQQIALARQSKSDRVFVLSKDFNIKQTTAEAWLREEDFNYDTSLINLEEFRDCIYLGGVDIAETTDLTSLKVLLMKQGDPRKYIHSMYFIPQSKIEKLADMDAGARYKEWANKGLLRIMEGNYLNASVVADYYYELYKKYHMRPLMIGYDNKFSNEFINKMDNYGFDYEVVWQRPETMSLPINMVEADLKSRVIIGLNEIDKWCLKNSTLKLNSFGYGILDKPRGQNSKKIDGAVSLCIAYEVFRRYETNFRSNLK